jgi:hypothetical protein
LRTTSYIFKVHWHMVWNFAHMFTIMPLSFRHEEVTISSFLTELCPFFDLKLNLKFAYHLKYFKVYWKKALKLFTLVHHHASNLYTWGGNAIKHFDLEFMLKFAYHLKCFRSPGDWHVALKLITLVHLYAPTFRHEEVTLSSIFYQGFFTIKH